MQEETPVIEVAVSSPAPPKSSPPAPWPHVVPTVVIILAAAVVYANSFTGQFVFDDSRSIGDNVTPVNNLWPPWRAVSTIANYMERPVAGVTFSLNYRLSGLNVWSYHAVNLLIHALAALCLFAILRRTFTSTRLAERFGAVAVPLALFCTLLWMLHPLQTESVTYILQREEALMGLFYLLTLYCVIRGVQSAHASEWYLAAVLSSLLGVGSKVALTTAPLVILLYDRTFLASTFTQALKRRWWVYGGLLATWPAAAWLLHLPPKYSGAGFDFTRITPWQYLRSQPGIILHYLGLSLWPAPLCIDYMWPVANSWRQIVPQGLAVLGLAGLSVWAVIKKPALGFLGAWFFLILAPTSSFIPIDDLAFEHRMYLPLAAVVVLVVAAGYRLSHALQRRAEWGDRTRGQIALVSWQTAIVPLLILAALTVRRNAMYSEPVDLWRGVVEQCPWNYRGHNNYGMALRTAGSDAAAEDEFREALRLNPNYWYAICNQAISLERRGRTDEAIAGYAKTLQYSDYLPAREALARLYCARGWGLRAKNQFKEAEADFRAAVRYKPDYWPAHYDLGLALANQGAYEAASQSFRESLRLNPDYKDTRDQLAWTECQRGAELARQGQWEAAIPHYQEAIRLWPDGYTQAIKGLNAALAKRKQTG